jgi:multicomponent Na+:H+ antiporter subunit A
MVWILISLVVAALFAPLVTRLAGRSCGRVLALVPAAACAWFATRIPAVAAGERLVEPVAWAPSLGVSADLALDGLSLVFALLVTGIGALTMVYARGYIGNDPRLGRLNATLLVFMTAMLGLVLSDDLVTAFVFWELTSVSSYLLVGYDHANPKARAAALQALLITGAGGLCLLCGVILIGSVGGTYSVSELVSKGDVLRDSSLYLPILLLVLGGCFTKSAQLPFHFWLPGAMAAPTPVSAYLHSATMVKAGVYLLARLSPALGGTGEWLALLVTFGATTMVYSAVVAFFQTDMKRILAYTSVSALGTLVMLLGIGTADAAAAATAYLIVHALYKCALFHVAGIVDHECGTRDVDRLGRLSRAMPITCVAACLAVLSMAGLPPFLGASAKGLVGHAEHALHMGPVEWAAMLTVLMTFAVGALLVWRTFFGRRDGEDLPKHPHEAPIDLWFSPLLLGSLGLLLGFFWGPLAHNLLEPAAAAIAPGVAPELHVHATAGSYALKAALAAFGLALYVKRRTVVRALRLASVLTWFGPERFYDRGLVAIEWFARAVTRRLQSGSLRTYLAIVLASTMVLAGYPLLKNGVPLPPSGSFDIRVHEAAIVLAMVLATIFVMSTRSRLSAIAALGIVGAGMSVTFLVFGAPDLAKTQLAIETLSVLLFLFILYRLPPLRQLSTRLQVWRDVVLSLTVGCFFALLVWGLTSVDGASRLSPFFAENSLALGKGHNVVNVILVDFRGIDTMGEITVLAVAALGVLGLMRVHVRERSTS